MLSFRAPRRDRRVVGVSRSAAPPAPPDDGFTLAEILVALGLIAVISSFAIGFHVRTLMVVRDEANRQVAAQLASEALDAARAGGGAALAAAPPPAEAVTVNGVRFTREWTVSACLQLAPGGACTAGPPTIGAAELIQVGVRVQWAEAGQVRSQRAAALVSSGAVDPTFIS
jgi:prepilin-type N-terminal cleavage/methylation domain-containing protein